MRETLSLHVMISRGEAMKYVKTRTYWTFVALKPHAVILLLSYIGIRWLIQVLIL